MTMTQIPMAEHSVSSVTYGNLAVTTIGCVSSTLTPVAIDLPAPQQVVSHALITLSGEFLMTLNWEFLDYA